MNDGQLSSVYTFNHDDDDMYFGVDGYVDCRDLAKMIIKELEK